MFRCRRLSLAVLLLVLGAVVAASLFSPFRTDSPNDAHDTAPTFHTPPVPTGLPPIRLTSGKLSDWWSEGFEQVGARTVRSNLSSNVDPSDYVGPETCSKCHPRQHEEWSTHPHRRMNALASEESIRGDFSVGAAIDYLGGKATFDRSPSGDYRMTLVRESVKRVYRITQTIGVRFFQYYVGKQVEGPEPASHHFYHKDHVLPFGYWLSQKEWAPVVHVGPEMPDESRPDPFSPPDHGPHYAEYAVSCNHCHTTFPLGDLFVRRPQQMGEHAPASMHWSVKSYLDSVHPEEGRAYARQLSAGVRGGPTPLADWDAPTHAATLGVSCEACHLGGKAHVESGGKRPPTFFPGSPHLAIEGSEPPDAGRTAVNLNWACGRCHTGKRPVFAAGMSTWNSVEYADAARGACYPKLRCIDCHNPHQPLGAAWKPPPERDDAVCLKCHDAYREAGRRAAHTHHLAGSAGDHCLNCHMPRLNEGLDSVVRTHMIFSPSRPDMIHANHPNACNLCHTNRSIDWTLERLRDWYGKTYDDREISLHYRRRSEPAAVGWLASDDPAVRLVAADAVIRNRDRQALPRLLDLLDDPFLVNRQFTARGIKDALGVKPGDLGYHFYQSHAERQAPINRVRELLMNPGEPGRLERKDGQHAPPR